MEKMTVRGIEFKPIRLGGRCTFGSIKHYYDIMFFVKGDRMLTERIYLN